MSGVDGKYYAFIPQLNCAVGDNVLVQAVKDDATGQNNGSVGYDEQCRINTALINVQIPEFGVIAGGLALLGALGVVIYRRKN
jgi:LPXTG-motif cell wall-anchored protein